MKKPAALALVVVVFNASVIAAPIVDKDGVPVVDVRGTIVKSTNAKAIESAKKWGLPPPSTRMIVVDKTQLSLKDFLTTYCKGKSENATCIRATKIQRIDSSKGPVESLPALI